MNRKMIVYNDMSYKGMIRGILLFVVVAIAFLACRPHAQNGESPEHVQMYKEIECPTPNFDPERENELLGVVLHHTAEPTVENALRILSSPEKKVGTHVVIDTDGTRYIMAKPTVVAYHAGYSVLNGRDSCNLFTLGIEFQGNTLESPLTDAQIRSGIEYLIPILQEYKIPLQNIVTHEMVRQAYKEKYPDQRCSGKVDITSKEYNRFMNMLKDSLNLRSGG